uniref:Guanosine-3',5'-bis(diphosphate) 3'-pyrophosphohydrolase MESH1 n=2 Tax=Clastoptera arizonana TaxID=38151 RepID=A0A1B6BZ71_9HEMI
MLIKSYFYLVLNLFSEFCVTFADISSDNMSRENEMKTLITCTNFAALKHRNQRRKDEAKTPYINHPIGVANILINEGGITDLEVICSALLHDTVEDTDTTIEEIKSEFGASIADIVAEVTDDKSLPKATRKELQIKHAPSSSFKAKLVKLADKVYNLRDLDLECPNGWSEQRREEYYEWSFKVVNGLRNTNKPMEDSLDEIFRRRGLM